jgi:hypothetical protein
MNGDGLPRNAKLHQDAALWCQLADGVVAVVGAVDRAIRRDVDAVGVGEDILAPGTLEFPVAVEHNHWVFAAIEDEDIVVLVDPNGGDFVEGPAVGELRPIAVDAIAEGALA